MFEEGKSSIGFEEGLVAAASYFPVLGLIILMIEKRSNFVRFHAVQSTLGFGVLLVFYLIVKWVGNLHSYLWWAPSLLAIVFALFMMHKAHHGEEYRLPIIGNLAFGAVFETDADILAESDREDDKATRDR